MFIETELKLRSTFKTKLVIAKARKKPSRWRSPTRFSDPSFVDFDIIAQRFSTLKSSSKMRCCSDPTGAPIT
jgi:hypothetical protein